MNAEPYAFAELDGLTRANMLSELAADIANQGQPYLGTVLTNRGRADYPSLLRLAIESGTEVDLAAELGKEQRLTNSPVDAGIRLARTEFNRYYIRGVCLRATSHDTNTVVVYRAHGSANPRSSSDSLIGTERSAPVILANLRGSIGIDPASGLGRVNSGVTIRCGCTPCRTN